MPVQTSLISGTQAHKHSSVSQDGGFLDDNVTGVTGTSNGSLIYFDGSSIAQNLGIGAASDQLRVNAGATAPEWFTPSAASSTFEVLADVTLGAPGTLSSGVFSAQDKFIKVLFYGASVASSILGITCNATAGATQYAYSSFRNYTTTTGGDLENEFGYLTGMSTSNPCFFEMTGYNGDSTDDKLFTISTNANTTTGNTRPTSYQSVGKWYGGAYITSFEIVGNNTGVAINMQTGSRMLVLATPA